MSHDSDDVVGDTERRGFVKFCAAAISVLLGAIPAGLGLGFLLDPLMRDRSGADSAPDPDGVQKDADGFIDLKVTVSSLPEDGTPVSVKVLDDRVDAWNKIPNVPIGTVWLRRTEAGEVMAFNTICPYPVSTWSQARPCHAEESCFGVCHQVQTYLCGKGKRNLGSLAGNRRHIPDADKSC